MSNKSQTQKLRDQEQNQDRWKYLLDKYKDFIHYQCDSVDSPTTKSFDTRRSTSITLACPEPYAEILISDKLNIKDESGFFELDDLPGFVELLFIIMFYQRNVVIPIINNFEGWCRSDRSSFSSRSLCSQIFKFNELKEVKEILEDLFGINEFCQLYGGKLNCESLDFIKTHKIDIVELLDDLGSRYCLENSEYFDLVISDNIGEFSSQHSFRFKLTPREDKLRQIKNVWDYRQVIQY